MDNTNTGEEIIELGSFTVRSGGESVDRRQEDSFQRRRVSPIPISSSPRVHPYQAPKSRGPGNVRPVTNSRERNAGSDHIRRLLTTPGSKPLSDDTDSSVICVREINYGNLRGQGGQIPAPPSPQRSPVPTRAYEFNNASRSSTVAMATSSNNQPTHNHASPGPARKRVATFVTPTRRNSHTDQHISHGFQPRGYSNTLSTPTTSVKITKSVGLQTTEDFGPPVESNEQPRNAGSTSQREVTDAETHPFDQLVNEVSAGAKENLRKRCLKIFNEGSESDKKRVMKALVNAKKGIKPDRSSSREFLELFAVVDPKYFPKEIDRLWIKDLEKVAVMEKEEKIKKMVEELNCIEENLMRLHTNIKEKTATEAELIEYNECAEDLAKKYFKYQKYLGSECVVRSQMYATQTQKFELSNTIKSKSTYPEVQKALELNLNSEREKFLNCQSDLDAIFVPLFGDFEEIVSNAMKLSHFEHTPEEIFVIAQNSYTQLVKEMKYRRMNDFWRSMLNTIRCPSIDALELSDPAYKHPALAERLEKNDTTAVQRIQEVSSEYLPSDSSDSELDVGHLLEEAINLEHIESNDDDEEELEGEEEPEGEGDRRFVAPDAVVPADEEETDFITIYSNVEQMHEGDWQ